MLCKSYFSEKSILTNISPGETSATTSLNEVLETIFPTKLPNHNTTVDLFSTYDRTTLNITNAQHKYLTTKSYSVEASEAPNSSVSKMFPHVTILDNEASFLPSQIETSEAWIVEPTKNLTTTSFSVEATEAPSSSVPMIFPHITILDNKVSLLPSQTETFEAWTVEPSKNIDEVTQTGPKYGTRDLSISMTQFIYESESVNCAMNECSVNPSSSSSVLHETSQLTPLLNSASISVLQSVTLLTNNANANTDNNRLTAFLPASQLSELYPSNIEIPTSSSDTYTQFPTVGISLPDQEISPTMIIMSDIDSSPIGSSFAPLPSVPAEQDTQTPLQESATTNNLSVSIQSSVNTPTSTSIQTISSPTQASTTANSSDVKTSIQTSTVSTIGKTSTTQATTTDLSAKEKLSTMTSGTATTPARSGVLTMTTDGNTTEKATTTSTMVLLDNNVTDTSETEMTTQAKTMLVSTEPSLNISAVPEEYWVITGEKLISHVQKW